MGWRGPALRLARTTARTPCGSNAGCVMVGTMLFVDEADALSGRRTEVHNGHDRYANMEMSHLLSRDGAAGTPEDLTGPRVKAALPQHATWRRRMTRCPQPQSKRRKGSRRAHQAIDVIPGDGRRDEERRDLRSGRMCLRLEPQSCPNGAPGRTERPQRALANLSNPCSGLVLRSV